MLCCVVLQYADAAFKGFTCTLVRRYKKGGRKEEYTMRVEVVGIIVVGEEGGRDRRERERERKKRRRRRIKGDGIEEGFVREQRMRRKRMQTEIGKKGSERGRQIEEGRNVRGKTSR